MIGSDGAEGGRKLLLPGSRVRKMGAGPRSWGGGPHPASELTEASGQWCSKGQRGRESLPPPLGRMEWGDGLVLRK